MNIRKSIISLLFALLPLFILVYFRNSVNDIEQYRELFWAISIPGFLYFIRYQIVRPIIRDEIVKPVRKIMATCARAIIREEDAVNKLRAIEALEE